MKNLILAALITSLLQNSWAQENGAVSSETPLPMSSQHPTVRPKPPEDLNKESSSFMGDPENLDPLRARQDSLKEDAEPVLEDIKQVLDAPPPPAPEIAPPEAPPRPKAAAKPKKKVVRNKPLPPKKQVKAKPSPKPKSSVVRRDDDPDEAMERRFYQNYMRYNSEPTSVEAWTAVSLGRSEEVYIVQKGDTLWSISETLFGDSLFWPKIWALNRQGIVNPHFILPGMNVRFYPGSSEDVPTLAVGNQNLTENGASSSDQPLEGFEFSDGSTSGSVTSSDGERSSYRPPEGTLVATSDGGPTPLPPSMPVYRSSRYFDKPQKIEIIDFNEPQRLKVEYPVDIFFTDRFVLSDLKISLEGNNHLNCSPGEVVRNFEFIRRTPTDEYTILEVLPSVNLDTDKKKKENNNMLYSYRRVGTIAQYAEGKLRIKTCRATLSKDLLYVPTSVLPSLKTNKISDKTPQVIGGPDVMNQNYYYDANFVYLDMGGLNFELGQDFQVISERIDGPAGTVRILDRFGSYAIGIILKETQPIFLGDRIVSQ